MHATRSRAMLVALAVVTGAAAPAMMMEPKGTFAGAKTTPPADRIPSLAVARTGHSS